MLWMSAAVQEAGELWNSPYQPASCSSRGFLSCTSLQNAPAHESGPCHHQCAWRRANTQLDHAARHKLPQMSGRTGQNSWMCILKAYCFLSYNNISSNICDADEIKERIPAEKTGEDVFVHLSTSDGWSNLSGHQDTPVGAEPMMHILTATLVMTYDDTVGETRVLVWSFTRRQGINHTVFQTARFIKPCLVL